MCKKRHGNNSQKDNFAERQYWKWEWLRRNKEYRKDFKKFGKGLLKALKKYDAIVRAQIEKSNDPPDGFALPHPYDIIYHQMRMKWGVAEGLRDPDDVSTESSGIVVYEPFVYARVSNDWMGEKKGVLDDRHTWLRPDGNPDWAITDESEENSEPLTPENCPRYLIVTVRVNPWVQKTSLLKAIGHVISRDLDKMLDAQTSVLKQKSLRPRFEEFETYRKIYDRIKKNRGKIRWSQIASEFFPGDLNKKSAINKVKQDYEKARWWIDEGWQFL